MLFMALFKFLFDGVFLPIFSWLLGGVAASALAKPNRLLAGTESGQRARAWTIVVTKLRG